MNEKQHQEFIQTIIATRQVLEEAMRVTNQSLKQISLMIDKATEFQERVLTPAFPKSKKSS